MKIRNLRVLVEVPVGAEWAVWIVDPFICTIGAAGWGASRADAATGAGGLACMKGFGGTWSGAESARFSMACLDAR